MLGRSGFRARGACPFAYFLENGRGGITRNNGNGDDAASGGFHFLAAHDLVAGPVATFHEHIGKQAGDYFAGSQVVEDHDGVDGFQSGENFRAFVFRYYRAAFAFQLTNARIAIEANDEHVAQCARQFQAADMAGMKKVKAPVGENDVAAVAFLACKPQNRFLKCQDC